MKRALIGGTAARLILLISVFAHAQEETMSPKPTLKELNPATTTIPVSLLSNRILKSKRISTIKGQTINLVFLLFTSNYNS